MKLAELAQKLSCRLEGPPELEISGVAGMEHAEPGQLTFLANRKYFALLKTTRASAILLEEGVVIDRDKLQPSIAALRSPNPYLAFAMRSNSSTTRRGTPLGFTLRPSSRRRPKSAKAHILDRIVVSKKK